MSNDLAPKTLSAWRRHTPENALALGQCLRSLVPRRRGILRQFATALIAATGMSDKYFRLSDIGASDDPEEWFRLLSTKEYLAAVEFLRDDLVQDEVTDIPTTDDIFAGLAGFCQATEREYEYAKLNVEGWYAVYRFSNRLHGAAVLRGRLKIWCDELSGAMKTYEEFAISRDKGAVHDSKFNREGYLVYRDRAPLIFSRKEKLRDIETIHLTKMHISNAEPSPEKVNIMEGFIVDWEQNQPYAVRVMIIDQGNDIEAQDWVRQIEPAEIPPDIAPMLMEPLEPIRGVLLRF